MPIVAFNCQEVSPFPAHTPSRRPADPSWSYRSTGYQDDCTTAAYTGHTYGTGGGERERWRWSHISSKCNNVHLILQVKLLEFESIFTKSELNTYSGAHLITHTEIKAALLIHGVVYPGKLREFGPFQLERIIQKTVVRAERNTAVWGRFYQCIAQKLRPKIVSIHSHAVVLFSVGCKRRFAAECFKRDWDLHHLPNPLLRCTEDHCRYEDQILTGCIDWAPVCCSGTSGIGETRPGRAEPWCCPYWSHLNSGSPDRHAPYPAWNIQHNHQNTAQYNHTECPVRFVSMNHFILTHWFFPVQHFICFAVKY